MRVVVVGAGSIGRRHLVNLHSLGHEVIAVDVADSALATVADIARTYRTLPEALAERPEAAFVCTHSNGHVAAAIECAWAGCHLFIEKPLSTDLAGVDRLIAECRARGLVTMVACNMRFHEAVRRVTDTLVRDPSFGRMLWADLEWGYYLPLARPDDWRTSYMANRSLGGDLVFDDIHELDLACWVLGQPVRVLATSARLGELTVDVDDCADMAVDFASGARARIHSDYLQHGYSRRLKVVAERGTLSWDFTSGRFGVVRDDGEGWNWYAAEHELRDNRMFVEEVEHFIHCVATRQPTIAPVESAVTVVRLALAAKRSCVSGTWEAV